MVVWDIVGCTTLSVTLQERVTLGQKGVPITEDEKSYDWQKRAKMDERKLTDGEKDKLKSLEKDVSKKDFIDRYGKEEGEAIYYATLTKMAKKHAEEIHEMSIGKIIRDKIYNMTHPKKMDNLVKAMQTQLQRYQKKTWKQFSCW